MSDEPAQNGGHEAESLIDEVIQAILSEAGGSPEAAARGKSSTTLFESAVLASTLTSSKASTLEKILVAEALGSALADALAPALAEQLTPKLLKYLEEHTNNSESPGRKEARATSSSGAASSGNSSRKAGNN